MRARETLLGATVATLLYATFPACAVTIEDGIAVELAARPVDSGSGVALDRGWLHVAEAALVACAPPRAGRWWAPARAAAHHGAADGRALAAPHVVALHEPAGLVLGALRPPPGRYCALRVVVTEADAEAEGFVEAMRGWAVRAEGRRDGAPLALRGYGQRALELPLVDRSGAPAALVVDAARPTAAVALEVDLGAAPAVRSDAPRDPEELGLDLMLDLESALTARLAP
jgi:hypothetical protein